MPLLSKYLLVMVLHFGMMLYSNLVNKNSDAGHMNCLHGPQIPHPGLNYDVCCFHLKVFS